MSNRSFTKLSRFFFSATVMIFLAGCSNNPNSFPQIASPPPFDYADGDELRTNMHQLAFELQKLDLSLMMGQDENQTYQQEIIDSLQNIERIGGYLRSGDMSTTHRFLRDGMDSFLADVGRAERDASRGTPRYYMAGRISGGCINCHRDSR